MSEEAQHERHEKRDRAPTAPSRPDKTISRGALLRAPLAHLRKFRDVVSDAVSEDTFPPIDQAGQRLMSRRQMLRDTAIITATTYATYKLTKDYGLPLVDYLTTLLKDPDPSPKDIADVEDLLRTSPNRSRDGFQQTGEPSPPSIPYKEIAEKYGLHLYDSSDFPRVGELYQRLYEDDKPQFSFEEYFNTAKDILSKNYGITLVLGNNSQSYEHGGRPLEKDELETKETKESLIFLLDSFFDKPVELIHQTGLKKVNLVKITKDNVVGYALSNTLKADTYFVDPTSSDNTILLDTFDHEVYHLYDSHTCGILGMERDPGFNDLNPQGAFYTGDPNLAHTDQYMGENEYYDLFRQIPNRKFDNSDAFPYEVEKAQNELDTIAQKVATASWYGFTNIVEDKAEIGKIIFSPEKYGYALDPRKPILRKKFIFLLARLYKQNPNIVKYLTEVCNQSRDKRRISVFQPYQEAILYE